MDAGNRTSEQIRQIVQDIIQERFGYPLEYVDVFADEDSAGEAILRIEVGHPWRHEPVEPDLAYGLPRQVRDALEQQGETRFPFIRHHFHDNQAVAS